MGILLQSLPTVSVGFKLLVWPSCCSLSLQFLSVLSCWCGHPAAASQYSFCWSQAASIDIVLAANPPCSFCCFHLSLLVWASCCNISFCRFCWSQSAGMAILVQSLPEISVSLNLLVRPSCCNLSLQFLLVLICSDGHRPVISPVSFYKKKYAEVGAFALAYAGFPIQRACRTAAVAIINAIDR